MRRHDFIQKKVVSYIQEFYFNNVINHITKEEKEKWNEFIDEISNFDNYDNYIDNMILDNDKIVLVQYYYSHVDNEGKLCDLDDVSESNIWIKDNIKYYKEVEKLMEGLMNKEYE